MDNDVYPFTDLMVRVTPPKRGVYTLYDNQEIIYIGCADGPGVTIRSRLEDHVSGRDGLCTRRATSFSVEISQAPADREQELLESHKSQFGVLPRCNERAD